MGQTPAESSRHGSGCVCWGTGLSTDRQVPFPGTSLPGCGFQVIKHANPEGKPQLEQLPYAIHFRYGLKYATVYDMEFAFPVDLDREDGFGVVLKAVDVVIKAIAEAAKPGEGHM